MANVILDPMGQPWPLEEVKASVGPGWGGLIEKLVDELFKLGWDGGLNQVKEKFGGLRFYTGACSNEQYEAITAAERESLRTCEQCGAPGGFVDKDGWYLTLCEKCSTL